jgi:hypothetical protein
MISSVRRSSSPRSVLTRWLSGSVLLVFAALAASGSVACAEEEFKACECFFPQCMDAMLVASPQLVCDKTRTYTYETCGKFCEQDVPVSLFLSGFTNCGTASSSLAKNSCSVGNPVGAP